ncbi:MAG: hypothetical protein EOO90_17095 [Pedobacter sp.]|nr:MAG: hypothetical protein EOO90_17095 [Pedobacter sp.]
MKDFLFNILPRLKAYSKELDITENIIDKPWIWISGDGTTQKLVFRRGGLLLMIDNGDVKTGTWEYIPMLHSFLIDRGIDKLLMNHQFLNESVMLLKKDGAPSSEILPFVNELNIPTLDYVKYLNDLTTNDPNKSESFTRLPEKQNDKQLSLWSLNGSETLVNCNNLRYGVEPSFTSTISTGTGPLSDGYYLISEEAYQMIPNADKLGRKLYNIKEGKLKEEFYYECFKTKFKGRGINIYYKHKSIMQSLLKDSAVLFSDTFEEVSELRFSCAFLTVLDVRNGRVISESMF